MKLHLAALLLVVPAALAAQDAGASDRGPAAPRTFDDAAAVQRFYGLAEGPDPVQRQQAESALAQALARKNLPAAAAIYDMQIVKSGTEHPAYREALQDLVGLQERLKDPFLIPTLLDTQYRDDWKALPPDVAGRVSYLVATSRLRGNKLEDARDLLLTVPADSPVYAKARYLLGIIYVDPRLPGGAQPRKSLDAFEAVLSLKGKGQQDLQETRELALLGLGRTLYGMGEYHRALEAYEQVPRFSRYWDQALFENGFARFRDGDPGGALGSLQALHAPQFEGSFQPESWLLKATIYHFACLFSESKASLKAFEDIYLPMADKLKLLVDAQGDDYASYYALVTDPKAADRLPRPVLLWVRGNERIHGLFELLQEIDREKAAIASEPTWRGSPLATGLAASLDQNRQTLVQTAGKLVKNRLAEAWQNIHKFSNDGDLIRLETTLGQKRLIEQGVDQRKLLADQSLYRPAMPSEAWNYWQFQGEFWIDEIGYYQYTLRQGCPVQEEEK